jgi:hypothetical protein
MPARLKTALSAGVHALVALLVSVLVAHGIDMPAGWSSVIETILLGAAVGLYAALTHWLSTRPKTTWWGSAAVWISRVLTLGTGALIPAPTPDPAVEHLLATAPKP